MALKVLVADDSKTMRRILLRTLKSLGVHDAVEASNGREAVYRFRNQPFDLVLLDWEMPELSGPEVLHEIRASNLDVPVVMVTSRADRACLLEAVDAGATEYLVKPFDLRASQKLQLLCRHLMCNVVQAPAGGCLNADYVNPFVSSVSSLFRTLFNWKLERGKPFVKDTFQPQYLVSGVIGMTGKARGNVVLSLSRDVALCGVETMLGERHATINEQVVDVVGELANMVAGGAQADLEAHRLTLSPPVVVSGKTHTINYPSEATVVCVPLECECGALSLEVGLVE